MLQEAPDIRDRGGQAKKEVHQTYIPMKLSSLKRSINTAVSFTGLSVQVSTQFRYHSHVGQVNPGTDSEMQVLGTYAVFPHPPSSVLADGATDLVFSSAVT